MAYKSQAAVALAAPAPTMGRTLRHPLHSFHLRTRPFQIQPFMIAPVLAGETMKNLLLQSRVVTDPLNSKLIGWWTEYYFFYVKARHLYVDGSTSDSESAIKSMFIDPAFNRAGIKDDSAKPYLYYKGTAGLNRINWVERCLRRVVENFFRDDGQAWNNYTLDNLPLAQLVGNNWADSLQRKSEMLLNDPTLTVGVDDVITGSEIDKVMQQWEFLRASNLTDMSYEDYLASYGVRTSAEESTSPELIRYIRDWQYPSNTVNATNGSVSTAVSWSIQERADKDRFFREPGFVFGVTLHRPKVYSKVQRTAMVTQMCDAYSWLPALLNGDPATSVKELLQTDTALGSTRVIDMVHDLKDLLLYGDQFLNVDLSGALTGWNMMNLPAADGINIRFPLAADIEALFVTPGTANRVEQDGIVKLSIAGTQRETTPRGTLLQTVSL